MIILIGATNNSKYISGSAIVRYFNPVSWQERLCRNIIAVEGTGAGTSESTTSTSRAGTQSPSGLCEEGERVVRAERARRALETLREVKRKTPGGTKKGKKK